MFITSLPYCNHRFPFPGTVLTSDVIGFGITPRQHSFSDVEADSSQGSKEKEEVPREETEVEPEKIVEEEKVIMK